MTATCPRCKIDYKLKGTKLADENCLKCGGPLVAPSHKKGSVRTVSGGLPSLGKRR